MNNLKVIDEIQKLISSKFDKITLSFLGIIPNITSKKIELKSKKSSLVGVFLQSLGTVDPNKTEEEALKICLKIASSYLDALKNKTTAEILNNINAELNKKPDVINISKVVRDGFNKATRHLNIILSAESNRCTNTATALKIQKIAANQGVEDPTVFFNVTVDDVTGPYEFILHLLPDKVTPRLYKMSEISHSYYKNGDQYPSLLGLHINCRCKITYLPPSFGFNDSGKITYIKKDHDEFKKQRDEYGLPNVPSKISRKKP